MRDRSTILSVAANAVFTNFPSVQKEEFGTNTVDTGKECYTLCCVSGTNSVEIVLQSRQTQKGQLLLPELGGWRKELH